MIYTYLDIILKTLGIIIKKTYKKISSDIKLIIECCKTSKDSEKIVRLISEIKNWNQFMMLALSHGIFPVVYYALKEYSNLIPKNLLSTMKSENMVIAKQNILMTSELIKIMKLLEENNIEAISFKGPVLSQMAYGNITFRQYCDLDILVNEDDLKDAVKLIKNLNYKTDENLLKKILKNKSIFHDISLDNLISVELHWRLFSDEFNTGIENIDIKQNLDELILSKNKLKSFQIEILVLYLCVHGAKHNWERIEWLLDISNLAINKKINWKILLKLAKESNTEKILYSTFYLCHNILDNKLPIVLEEKIKQKKILKLSKDFENLFYNRFKDPLSRKIESKNISKIQFDLLEGYKSKFLFFNSLLKPTEKEFELFKLPSFLHFIYYVSRPFNILLRWIKRYRI